jgi:lysozyme family protein
MKINFNRALQATFREEGGFVNNPKDPGGATNKGITIGTYRRYVNRRGTVADLKAITDEQAGKIYRTKYWNKINADELPSGIDYATYDFAVNSGPARAAKYLQRILGVQQDGIIGNVTLAAAMAADSAKTIDRLCDDRLAFLKRIKGWATFGNGWTSRVARVRALAKDMARVKLPKYPPPLRTTRSGQAKGPVGAPSTPNWLSWLVALLKSIFKKGN